MTPPPPTIAHVCPCKRACQPPNVQISSTDIYSSAQSISKILHTTLTPQHRSNPSHAAHTPYALLNIKPYPIQLPPLHPHSANNPTQTHAPNSIQSTHKQKHKARARTPPAATITTPALSPVTATGASRFVPEVPSPTCADQKTSRPHHKPAHPISLFQASLLRETPLHLPDVVLPPTP